MKVFYNKIADFSKLKKFPKIFPKAPKFWSKKHSELLPFYTHLQQICHFFDLKTFRKNSDFFFKIIFGLSFEVIIL